MGGRPGSGLRVSAEVAALVGRETVRELSGAAYEAYDCCACGEPGRTAEATSVVVILHRDSAARVRLAHAGCAASEVIGVRGDFPVSSLADGEVMARAAVWRFAGERAARPVLLVEPRLEAFAVDGAERVNIQVAAWVERGLSLVRAWDSVPGTAPGWVLEIPGEGWVRLVAPGGGVLYEGECEQPGPWPALVAESGSCVVLAGTIGLWAAAGRAVAARRLGRMLRRAARGGALTGGLVPARYC